MSDWDQRQLCPDGGCVGVIGTDGTCKVCGRVAPNWGDERNRGLLAPSDEDDVDDDDDVDDEDDEGADDEAPAAYVVTPAAEGEPGWDDRKLCPDDACIGLIGADGRCKVCHRSAA
jgi:hypothetical protein